MNCNKIKLKEGINLHIINTNKFKTNLLAVFLTTPLNRENVTKNALIPMILRRGSSKLTNLEEISNKLDEMYGADFNCGVDKTGDNHVLKFYMESINNNFLPERENILEESMKALLDIVFNPLIENSNFKKEYVESEKENIKQIILGKIDNKSKYAYERCIEEMYKDKPFGLYKYGYVEDLENINAENLYEYYKKMISECKIDIFISGEVDESAKQIVMENEDIKKLNDRQPIYNKKSEKADNIKQERVIEEKMDVSQGKLIIGLEVGKNDKDSKYSALIYNAILGGTPTSKMFQNVREKAHLAYVAGSNYIRHKNNVFIRCGIEIEDYKKALDLIRVQIEDMKKADFTEEDIKNAKASIIAMIKSIPEEQDSEMMYYFGQEISEHKMEYAEYEENVQKVQKQDVVDIANSIKINTVYFLRN
ncbi:MAG: insulinase family protein [Clostridia bacterium]|nr:insulinase family protein [Clostridia bacterium]